ncbi:MAG: FtsW/RodA/SpoVE family cell cycle protein [Cyclobacteriaceae bacterium]|nr:FtsW/RodA/SpoVE family cell cycle protein [Cyclobacteriaceae bacterium]
MKERIKIWCDNNLQGDPVIWSIVFALSIISIAVVYSATGTLAFKKMANPESYLFKHSMLVLLGLFAMWAAHRVDYRYYSKLSWIALWLSIPLLLYTFIAGVKLNEASRWLHLPLINQSFQPSDLASLALIMRLTSMLSKKQQNIDNLKDSLIPMLIWCGVICGLIALTNFSSAVLLFITCMLIMFIGRVPLKYLSVMCFVGLLAGVVAIGVGQRGSTVVKRIDAFVQGDELPFQAEQARIAIATGGLFGRGPGQSTQRNILPHPYSDFVYAIIIEEYGIVGGIFVLSLYLVLLYRGMRLVSKSENAFGGLLAAGLGFAIVFQAMVNMGVVVGLGPITGIPLPLVSMGGTSMLFTGISLGIILSVSRGEIDQSWNVSKGTMHNIPKAA